MWSLFQLIDHCIVCDLSFICCFCDSFLVLYCHHEMQEPFELREVFPKKLTDRVIVSVERTGENVNANQQFRLSLWNSVS